MSSIVLELQQMASEGKTSTYDLLRKALIVASKLNLTEFERWVTQELEGYGTTAKNLPQYRIVPAKVYVDGHNFHQAIIIPAGHPDLDRYCSSAAVTYAVAEVEDYTASGSFIKLALPSEIERRLESVVDFQIMVTYAQIVNRSSYVGILDRVRTTVLKWSLQLEKEGILGERLRFSEEEKKKATSSPSVTHITNFISGAGNRAYFNSTDGSDNTVQLESESGE